MSQDLKLSEDDNFCEELQGSHEIMDNYEVNRNKLYKYMNFIHEADWSALKKMKTYMKENFILLSQTREKADLPSKTMSASINRGHNYNN
jgi:hypothetical protein